MDLLKEHEGDLHLRKACREDLSAIFALLEQVHLPSPLQNESVAFLVAELPGKGIVGCIGWEIHGNCALLRSLAVETSSRNRGMATALTESAMDELSKGAITELVLLTVDAASFAARLGFEKTERNELPAEIKECIQISSSICQSACCMRRRFTDSKDATDQRTTREGASPG